MLYFGAENITWFLIAYRFGVVFFFCLFVFFMFAYFPRENSFISQKWVSASIIFHFIYIDFAAILLPKIGNNGRHNSKVTPITLKSLRLCSPFECEYNH